jgi:hypothetical protein
LGYEQNFFAKKAQTNFASAGSTCPQQLAACEAATTTTKATTTITKATTPTTKATSITTTTAGVDASKLEGSASFYVPGDVNVFISNQAYVSAMKKGFAASFGVAESKFTKFQLIKSTRRLDVQKEASVRQLAAANVNVAYGVDLKGLANANQITTTAKTLQMNALTQKVQEKLKAVGYTQAVVAKSHTAKNPVVTTTVPIASAGFGSQDTVWVTMAMLPLAVLLFW